MYVENITSNGMTLNPAGKSMQIEIYEKEIERLNNIINELEKWLDSEISYWGEDYETLMCSDRIIYLEETLNKLKELKGGK